MDSDEVVFGRVLQNVGFGHLRVGIDTSTGPKEIQTRIPKSLSSKFSTPINSYSVIAVFVGPDFDPDDFDATTHFDVFAIMTEKQVYALRKEERIPEWMVAVEPGSKGPGKGVEESFEFDRSEEAAAGGGGGGGRAGGTSRHRAVVTTAPAEELDIASI